MAGVLAVRAVDRGEEEILHARGEQARSELLLARESLLRHLQRLAAEDGDAVPALLAVEHGVVAGPADLLVRELLVGELQLLEADDVGLPLGEPVEHEVEAGAQAVHVPGGDAQGGVLTRVPGWEVGGVRA